MILATNEDRPPMFASPEPHRVGRATPVATFTPDSKLAAEPAALLDTRQAASFLNFSVSTLHKWRFHKTPGTPPFIRCGTRAIRYERAALEVWKATRTEAAR